jgi:aryl-alcohol dehydrogenase-like predicted oxidoreductase
MFVMEKRQLGKTDMQITPIGFGTWAIGGGGWKFGWGPQEDKQSIEAINRAIDLGMNWIDTAAVYGLGHAEEVVEQALRGRSDKPYIFTKCSLVWDNQRNISNNQRASSIRREVEDSLRRLKVDVIDLYQVHWPFPDEQIEEGWTTMAELKEEGKVRHIGVSNYNVEQMRRAQAIAPIATQQPPYSLIKRGIEGGILDYCAANNIGVIVYAPMQSGLLTGKMTPERVANMPEDDWRRSSPDFQEPQLSKNLKLVDLLRDIGNRHGRSPGEVAIAWTLRQPAVTGAIVGGRNAGQVDGIIGAGEFRLSKDEIDEIESMQQKLS